MNVKVFVTDIGTAAAIKKAGGSVQRIPPNTLIPSADTGLGLCGRLIAHFANAPIVTQEVPEMSDNEWKTFLDEAFSGKQWTRWYGTTPTAIYSIVVGIESTDAHRVVSGVSAISGDRHVRSDNSAVQVNSTSTRGSQASAPPHTISATCNKCGRGIANEDGLCDNTDCDDGPPIRFRSILGRHLDTSEKKVGAKHVVTTTTVQYEMSSVREHSVRQRHFSPMSVKGKLADADIGTGIVSSLVATLLGLGLLWSILPTGLKHSGFWWLMPITWPILCVVFVRKDLRERAQRARTPPAVDKLMEKQAESDRQDRPHGYYVRVFPTDAEWNSFVVRMDREKRMRGF